MRAQSRALVASVGCLILKDEAFGPCSSDSKAEAGDLVVPDEQIVRPSIGPGVLTVDLSVLDERLRDGLSHVGRLRVPLALSRVSSSRAVRAGEQLDA